MSWGRNVQYLYGILMTAICPVGQPLCKETHFVAVGLKAIQCGETYLSRWSTIGYEARICRQPRHTRGCTLPSTASINRTGVSRTLAMKQNVVDEFKLAEGYHCVAAIASGWAKHLGGSSDSPRVVLLSASSRCTALHVMNPYDPVFCRGEYRCTIMTPACQIELSSSMIHHRADLKKLDGVVKVEATPADATSRGPLVQLKTGAEGHD